MFDQAPIRWTEPATWPWFIYVWLAFLVAGTARPVWKWLHERAAREWPAAQGQITSAAISEKKTHFGLRGDAGYEATLRYTYFAVGENHTGVYRRQFPTEEEAQEFVRELEGRTTTVHYHPNRPGKSTLSEESLATLHRLRPPAPPPRVAAPPLPGYIRAMLWPLVGVSALGLVLSLWVHFSAVVGRLVAPSALFILLHVGIFVVWLPTVLTLNKRYKNQRSWKVLLSGAPQWMVYLVYASFAYAMINFVIFLGAPAEGSNGEPSAAVWRGFSGHWMVFYMVALTVLYAAATGSAEEPPRGGQQ